MSYQIVGIAIALRVWATDYCASEHEHHGALTHPPAMVTRGHRIVVPSPLASHTPRPTAKLASSRMQTGDYIDGQAPMATIHRYTFGLCRFEISKDAGSTPSASAMRSML